MGSGRVVLGVWLVLSVVVFFLLGLVGGSGYLVVSLSSPLSILVNVLMVPYTLGLVILGAAGFLLVGGLILAVVEFLGGFVLIATGAE